MSEPQDRDLAAIGHLASSNYTGDTKIFPALVSCPESDFKAIIEREKITLRVQQFEQPSSQEDLDALTKLMSMAPELAPDNNQGEAGGLTKLGISYQKPFDPLGDLSDLFGAVERNEQAVLRTPDNDPAKHAHLSNLGISYQSLFERLGSLDHLHKSIACIEQAILLIPDSHPHKPALLSNLGNSYQGLFKCLGRLDDLHKSVASMEQAVLLTPDDQPHKPLLLSNLGATYNTLFDRLGRLDDLHMSINCKEQVVMMTPDDHPTKPDFLSNLGNSYHALFLRLGRVDDMHKAIGFKEQAVVMAPDGHPRKAALLNNLGLAHESLFDRLGGLEDLQKATLCKEQAVLLTPDDHPAKPGYLNDLGVAYHSLFNRLCRLDDLHKSVNCKEQAVTLVPDNHPDKPRHLNNLGGSYRALYERLGQLDYLDKSVNCCEQALKMTPDGHPRRPKRLNTLALAYLTLFERLGKVDDIHQSINCNIEAVSLTPDDDPSKPGYLNGLGIGYLALFERLKQLDSLEKSASCLEQAVTLTPDDHPEKPIYLNNIGGSYLMLFDLLDRLDDIHHSINYREQAVKLTPDGHVSKPELLKNLGHSHLLLFERQGTPQDAEQAVGYLKQAVLSTPDGHPQKSACLSELGKLYASLFKHSRMTEYGLTAIDFFKLAALAPTGNPSKQLESMRLWALESRLMSVSPLEAYQSIMGFLPQIVWLGTSVQQRYERIAKFEIQNVGTLVTEAATAAIARQRYDLALEWLEEGRSIVWGQMLQLRTPYDELYAVHPDMAAELQSVSHQLEHAAMSHPIEQAATTDGRSLHEIAWEQRRLAQRREELLDSARLLPGLEDFLRPPNARKLLDLVQDGVVVVVNVHAYRCDALVIHANTQEVTHVPLCGFSFAKAENARTRLSRCLREQGSVRGVKGGAPRDSTFKNILAMLWYDVAQPVLDHLNISQALPADELPHITWCTTGPLIFLPLHAAGDYDSPDTVLPNLVISSYIPTIGSLSQPTSSPGAFSGILAVGHESPIRGFGPIPGTKAELHQVQMQAKHLPFTRLDGENASTDGVLKAMGDHSWVHFACHASQNLTDPMKSAFHLHDKDLDLATISRNPLKNAQLAFLSACQTATGDTALPDESIHLAAGLLMAGYPSVIATMWSICDQDAPLVAGRVYEYLLEGGKPDSRKAAKALHKAVTSLRETIGGGNFARWVPYVHIGR
ncbi:hypothetical protein FS749_008749 [Ceratobasidium sp. UAMH 11750]|nr:hypothetical protein FS749_008749 [Ceratobasidium sp. UAMH 11750]